MTATVISADVSRYQTVVTNAYTRRWLIFRVCDGSFFDEYAIPNARWCQAALAAGRIDGWTGYGVYRPGQNAGVMANFAKIGAVDHAMIDAESWGGAIQGDHSGEINQLAASLNTIAKPKSDAFPAVWGYGNAGDLASIWRTRNTWVIVAGYTSTRPNVPLCLGWQYTNGTENHTANPSSSAPFGACDHNELYPNMHTVDGGGTEIIDSGDDDMPLSDADKNWLLTAINTGGMAIVNGAGFKVSGVGIDQAWDATQEAHDRKVIANNDSAASKSITDPTGGVLVRVAQLQAAVAALHGAVTDPATGTQTDVSAEVTAAVTAALAPITAAINGIPAAIAAALTRGASA